MKSTYFDELYQKLDSEYNLTKSLDEKVLLKLKKRIKKRLKREWKKIQSIITEQLTVSNDLSPIDDSIPIFSNHPTDKEMIVDDQIPSQSELIAIIENMLSDTETMNSLKRSDIVERKGIAQTDLSPLENFLSDSIDSESIFSELLPMDPEILPELTLSENMPSDGLP